jgi:hypothetical protein
MDCEDCGKMSRYFDLYDRTHVTEDVGIGKVSRASSRWAESTIASFSFASQLH